ncbi:Na+-transporting NADH:ubiquinone oxidoreductase subunit C [Desulfocicer vacuolatum DSM 3385]|uniref:Na(+)-translocating NADH-quinone reductase subunit C n=1 Tax=Desulfocicer vacuolatum DSM 3385 TaxID=1121400 RepID=A0A1W2ESG7_9BACT|nr:FMN-binding protein [Desulfocicer vacuolatum]SMD12639.1 Na+-transporting NADH:ubiquinone oxidoreductase subunit C [Desulfocicer vacuolatum DSM 3385]
MSEPAKSEQAKRRHAVKFAAIISVVCCLLITGASTGLKPFQQENRALDRQKNILRAAGIVALDAKPSRDQIQSLFREKIHEAVVDNRGNFMKPGEVQGLSLYLYREKNILKAYVIPIESRGLWGKIKGYIALEPDGRTVSGFTVYSHSETPGLGGEIEKAWFQKNFVGKKIYNSAHEFVSVSIARGSVDSLPRDTRINHVDGISGATLTGKYLTRGLKENLKQYEAVSVRLRNNKGIIRE